MFDRNHVAAVNERNAGRQADGNADHDDAARVVLERDVGEQQAPTDVDAATELDALVAKRLLRRQSRRSIDTTATFGDDRRGD